MTTVYKPSAKAMRAKAFNSPDERIFFLGDGSAMHYDTSGHLIQSDLLYRNPDSHLIATDEKVPEELSADWQELEHMEVNRIQLPCKLTKRF